MPGLSPPVVDKLGIWNLAPGICFTEDKEGADRSPAFHKGKKWREWEEGKTQLMSLFSPPLGCLTLC